jgi:hypothetical protein
MASFPGASNTYLVSTDATNNLVVDFSRNPKTFKLSDWTRYTPVKKNHGAYIRMTVEEAGRILNTNGSDFLWGDGATAEIGQGNTESFNFETYRTKRHAFPYAMGELAADQAQWDVTAQHDRIKAQQAMTMRTQAAVTAAQTGGSYASGHSLAVTSISGVTGAHDLSTTARRDIKRTIDYGADLIRVATLGAVMPKDIIVVVGPDYARRVSNSQELVDHIKHSDHAREEIESGLGPNSQYALPSTLYGYKLVVEDAVKTTSRKGGTVAKSYIWGTSYMLICARPGALEGIEGSPDFATVTVFLKEEMTVENKHDKDNRRYLGRVVDDFGVVVTAPATGVLVSAVLS